MKFLWSTHLLLTAYTAVDNLVFIRCIVSWELLEYFFMVNCPVPVTVGGKVTIHFLDYGNKQRFDE